MTIRQGGSTRRARGYVRAAVLLLGLLPLVAAACSTGSGNGPALAKDQVFTWPYQNKVTSIEHGEVFDPAIIETVNDSPTVEMIYANLVTFNSGLGVIPDAATWSVDSTGKVYTFNLRPNLFFSDGTPLTAADYAYSINRALDPTICTALDSLSYGFGTAPKGQPASGQQCASTPPATDPTNGSPPYAYGYLSYIVGAAARVNGTGGNDHSMIGQGDDPNHGLDVIDQRTLKIRLTQPYPFFLEALTYPTSLPVEQKLINKYPNGLWVDHLDQGGCSGPFMVKSYGGGQQMTLVPNPYWAKAWGKQLTLTQVNRPLVQQIDQEYSQYIAGQYDFSNIPTGQYSFARGQNDFHDVPTLATNFFGLNVTMAPFDNLLVRRAFAFALNKQLLVDRVLSGSELPTNHIVPLGMPGFNPDLKTPPPDSSQTLTGNQADALDQLKKAQAACPANPTVATTANTPLDYCPYVTGPKLEIDVYVDDSDPTLPQFVSAATDEWSNVLGLNVKTKVITFVQLVTAITGKPVTIQAWNIAWIADFPDPEDFLSLQFHGKSGNEQASPDNFEGFNDPSINQQMDQADVNQNATQRMQQYNQIEQEVVNQVPWIPYSQGKAFWRQRQWVHGFGLNSLQYMVDINWPNVYIAAH